MRNFRLYNLITGWFVFLIAAIVYLLTIEPSTSFWDCGEFISAAYKLEVGHPPGAPFFMLIGRFFTLFASDKSQVALMINSMSALASAFTILFLFWTITHLAKKFFNSEKGLSIAEGVVVLGSGLVGSLAYTFSDTFWFSAVEGEVYAMSSLMTAIVFWAALKWENSMNNRWLILIAYFMGLSVGVHLLNLLAIPAIVLVYFFRQYPVNRKNVLIALGSSAIVLAAIMYGIIPGVVYMASRFELLFVNTLGMSFHSGLLIYLFCIFSLLAYGIYITHIQHKNFKLVALVFVSVLFLSGIATVGSHLVLGIIVSFVLFYVIIHYLKKNYAFINTALLFITVIIIGYSSYGVVLIRSAANPPMDQNNPENLFNLLSYLNREQYGDRPLIYGHYYSAPLETQKEGKKQFSAAEGEYEKTGNKTKYIYDSRFTTVFPRMYSPDPNHIEAYKTWADIKGIKVRGAKARDGSQLIKPTFTENIRFFFRYQIRHMYLRYFMWNFAGRQNDIQSHYKHEITNGNWISGISFIDEMRLGELDNFPDSLKNNPAHNRYFMLPLLLGLLGVLIHYKKSKNDFWVVMLLFFFTGLAIVIYLNQTPFQPRERDYAYAGSFYAFAIWIGLGVIALFDLMKIIRNKTIRSILSICLSFVGVPMLMAKENWDDHDRSDRYTARDFAYNYLMSCKQNGIIFTNGDNDTFPLWFAQEVEEYRTDVRVINLSYLSADWYIEQMEQKVYDSPPVDYQLTKKEYGKNSLEIVYIIERLKNQVLLSDALSYVASDEPKTKQIPGYQERIDHFPSKNLIIPADSLQAIQSGLIPEGMESYFNLVDIQLSNNYITKNHLMVLDIISSSNWERPVYYAITVSAENYLGLDEHFIVNGMTYLVAPIKSIENPYTQRGLIDSKAMYENLVKQYKWGGLEEKENNIYLDENNRRMLTNYRNSFAMLAHTLIDEGRYDSALIAIDRCFEIIDPEKVTYDYFTIPLLEGYYKLNELEKANFHANAMGKVIQNELDYYLFLPASTRRNFDYELRLYMTMLNQIIELTGNYNQSELNKELKTMFDVYMNRLQTQ